LGFLLPADTKEITKVSDAKLGNMHTAASCTSENSLESVGENHSEFYKDGLNAQSRKSRR
jgi:hypothetical protein